MTISRRQFLLAAAAAVAAAACTTDADYDVRALASTELLHALDPGIVRAIGERYRAMTPDERDADSLRDAIVASRGLRARLLGGAEPVAALVHADFEAGRTVVVDGWVLSVTEARQCALFSLLPA